MIPAEALRKEQAKAAREALEMTMAQQLRAHRIVFERELQFHPKRRWRFDFAIPSARLAIEVQGGVFSGGRHSRGKGITDECEKVAHALMAGWRVMPVTGAQVRSGQAVQWVLKVLGATC